MGGNDCSNVEDLDVPDIREISLQRGLKKICLINTVRVTNIALAGIVLSIHGMFLHLVHRAGNGTLFAAHFVIGNDLALIVEAHNGTNIENGAEHGDWTRHSSALAIELEIRGVELVMDVLLMRFHPICNLLNGLPLIPHICRVVHKHSIS